MKRFKEMFEEEGQQSYGYVGLKARNFDTIHEFIRGSGFYDENVAYIDPENFHVTLAFDSTNPIKEKQDKPMAKYLVSVKEVEIMGNAVVLTLYDHGKLHKRWEQLRKIGFKWDYEGYKPHISLIYTEDEELQEKLYNKLKKIEGLLSGLPFNLFDEYWNEVKDG